MAVIVLGWVLTFSFLQASETSSAAAKVNAAVSGITTTLLALPPSVPCMALLRAPLPPVIRHCAVANVAPPTSAAVAFTTWLPAGSDSVTILTNAMDERRALKTLLRPQGD